MLNKQEDANGCERLIHQQQILSTQLEDLPVQGVKLESKRMSNAPMDHHLLYSSTLVVEASPNYGLGWMTKNMPTSDFVSKIKQNVYGKL